MDEADDAGGMDVEITVLAKGDTFLYTIPSFPVFKATLQQVKIA